MEVSYYVPDSSDVAWRLSKLGALVARIPNIYSKHICLQLRASPPNKNEGPQDVRELYGLMLAGLPWVRALDLAVHDAYWCLACKIQDLAGVLGRPALQPDLQVGVHLQKTTSILAQHSHEL